MIRARSRSGVLDAARQRTRTADQDPFARARPGARQGNAGADHSLARRSLRASRETEARTVPRASVRTCLTSASSSLWRSP
jgi:hypothetical protein